MRFTLLGKHIFLFFLFSLWPGNGWSSSNYFENVKQLVKNEQIKKIYCEASWKSYNAHIEYEMLKEIKCDKLVLMHFEDIDLYNLAIKDIRRSMQACS